MDTLFAILMLMLGYIYTLSRRWEQRCHLQVEIAQLDRELRNDDDCDMPEHYINDLKADLAVYEAVYKRVNGWQDLSSIEEKVRKETAKMGSDQRKK